MTSGTPAAPARRRQPNLHPGQAKTTYVRKRLNETLEFISRKNLIATCPGVTRRTIELALTSDSTTISWKVATPLDWAWAKYVQGHDLWDLDVTHGTTTTYSSYACRCQPCAAATTVRERHRLAGHPAPGSPLRDARQRERVGLHLARLREHATMRFIAKTAGIDHYTVQKIAGDPTYGITMRTAVAILNVKVSDAVGDPSNRVMVDTGPTLHRIRCMRALGFPVLWQEAQIGTRSNLTQVPHRNHVTLHTAERIEDLAKRVGDRRPTAADGIDPFIAARTRREALRNGWYPFAAYDDDGNLDPRAIPGHKWAIADEWCAQQVEANYRLSLGWTTQQAAKASGVTSDSLAARPKHGLTYVNEGSNGVRLDYTASGERISQFHDVYSRYDANEIGAVTAALELSIARGDYRTRWSDHPEVVAWEAAQREESAAVPTATAA